MTRTLLIVPEVYQGKLREVSLEAAAAAALCAKEGDRIAAAVVGTAGIADRVTPELADSGAAAIYAVEHAELARYQPESYAAALLAIIEHTKPDAVFLGHTSIGRDVAPLLSARLNAGQISDVIAIDTGDSLPQFIRPIYAGKAIESRRFTASSGEPWIVTIRPNNIKRSALNPAAQPLPVTKLAYPAVAVRAKVIDVVHRIAGRIDLSEAKIVVAGGRGVKSAEGFQPLQELAEALGGAVGASRGACDAGYCEYSLQIGQTGKVVTPELYIACGISGAIQHLAGMSGSRVIVAINKDPDAPIFAIADYGIVGDLFEVVPLLTAQIRKSLQSDV